MKKKIIICTITFLIIGLGIGGYYYYKNLYMPTSFVNSFLEELEFKGADFVDSKYFVSESYTNIIIPWDKYYESQPKSRLSKDVLYQNWEETYFSEIGDYIVLKKMNYDKYLMQETEFRNTFRKLDFSDIKVDYKELRNKLYIYYCHVNIKAKNHYIDMGIEGKQKFKLLVMEGKLGWKIIGLGFDI